MISDYLKLCRVSNLPTIWTNVLAAALLSGSDAASAAYLVPALGMSLLYSGGMAMNDIVDADRDRIRKAFRPIPSGSVSRANAIIFTMVLFLSGLAVLGAAPHPEAILNSILLLLLILAYNLLHNGFSGSILLMAGCRFMVYAVTAFAVRGGVPVPVLIAGSAQFLYALLVSFVARKEKEQASPLPVPVPLMIAGFSLLDGLFLAVFISPSWIFAGIAGAALTLSAQKTVRGD